MTTSDPILSPLPTTWGDAAVDGLCAGFAAGWLMAAYLAGYAEWADIGATALFAAISLNDGTPLSGLLAHSGMAVVYGTIFGVGLRWLRRWLTTPARTVGLGGVYGLSLAGLAYIMQHNSEIAPFVALPHVHLLIAHLAYGLGLGLLCARINQTRQTQ